MSVRTSVEAFVALIIVVACAIFSLHERHLRDTIAERDQTIAALELAIQIQNEKVRDLQQEAELQQSRAALAATRVLAGAQGARERINQAGAGPEEMNRWIRSTFVP